MKTIASMSQAELAAYVQSALRKEGIDAVLTGGAVVALYSHGKYVSMDLDLVDQGFASTQKIKKAMEGLDFKRKGRHYSHPDSQYLVEFVAPPLSVGNEPVAEVVDIKLSTGTLRVLSPTDCVKDRLAAFFYWSDRQSLEQALLVAKAQKVKLKEIERWSKAEKMADKYQEFVTRLKKKKSS